ncbi:hypothetical protein ACP275_08G145300 [Erythranthe tilingii]
MCVSNEVFETMASEKTTNTTRHRGLFILLGPSIVGKTEIAKAVARHWSKSILWEFWNKLTEIVGLHLRDVYGERFVVHASNEAIDVLSHKATRLNDEGGGSLSDIHLTE